MYPRPRHRLTSEHVHAKSPASAAGRLSPRALSPAVTAIAVCGVTIAIVLAGLQLSHSNPPRAVTVGDRGALRPNQPGTLISPALSPSPANPPAITATGGHPSAPTPKPPTPPARAAGTAPSSAALPVPAAGMTTAPPIPADDPYIALAWSPDAQRWFPAAASTLRAAERAAIHGCQADGYGDCTAGDWFARGKSGSW